MGRQTKYTLITIAAITTAAGLIRDQRYRADPEYRNADAGIIFFQHFGIYSTHDFSASFSKNNIIFSCLWTSRVYPRPPPAVWTCRVYTLSPPSVWTSRVYPRPPPAVWTCRVYTLSPPAVWTCRVYPSPLLAVWTCRVFVYLFLNTRMPDCPASGQSGTEMNKNTEPEPVR